MFFLFTWYIPYFAQNDASVSYNFYQVSTPLRLIIYYFWKFSKYFPTYTQPLLRAVSLFCLYLTRTTWKTTKTNQQQARASIAAIVLCTDIIHAFLSGKVVHFLLTRHFLPPIRHYLKLVENLSKIAGADVFWQRLVPLTVEQTTSLQQ